MQGRIPGALPPASVWLHVFSVSEVLTPQRKVAPGHASVLNVGSWVLKASAPLLIHANPLG